MATVKVEFYKNFGKKANSTKQPLSTAVHDTFNCYLKDNCEVTEPVIEIAITGSSPLNPINPANLGYNYAFIEDFNRYYFVTRWRYYKGTWTASLNVDVLASFKSQIGNLTKYVNRSSYTFDGTLGDTVYPSKAAASVSYVYSDNPFRVNPYGSYIVGIIGASQINVPCIGGINYYLFTPDQMAEFISFLMGNTMATVMSDPAEGLSSTIVKTLTNPLDYISSCIWFPFEIVGVTTANRVQPKLGWWDNITPVEGGLVPLGGGQFDSLKFVPGGTWGNSLTIPQHPQAASRGSWLDGSPYSKYTFHLDPWGDIELDAQEIINNKTITYSINCEGLSGMGILELYGSQGRLLTRRTAQVGVSIAIAQIITDYSSMMSSQGLLSGAIAGGASGNGIKNAWKSIKDILSFQTARVSEGTKALFGGGLLKDIGSDVLSGVLAYNTDMSTSGVAGSLISYVGTALSMSGGSVMYSQGAWIKIVRFELVDEDNIDRGRPLCKLRQLSSIPGYIECAEGEHDIAALGIEKEAISSYLIGGFFYE